MIFKDKTAVALGSFDGLHKGHMSVIACALSMKECGLVPLALLFDSHPMLALTGQAPPRYSKAPREKDCSPKWALNLNIFRSRKL